MSNIDLIELLSCNLGDLVEILYDSLVENDADEKDNATIEFGNNKFTGTLTIQLKQV